jgi:plastocyanin
MRNLRLVVSGLVVAAALAACGPAVEEEEVHLVIQDHQFQPAEITASAGKRIKLVIENRDDTAEEFESHTMKAEKVIGPKTTATVTVGPLEPGSYEFFGEFNQDTAQGTLVAR